MNTLKRIVILFSVVSCSLIVNAYSMEDSEESIDMANKCFARFLFGINNSLPGIIIEEYQVGIYNQETGRKAAISELKRAISQMFICQDNPKIIVNDKHVFLVGQDVIITFIMTLNYCESGVSVQKKFNEKFTIRNIDSNYVIVDAKIFPNLLSKINSGEQNGLMKEDRTK